MKWKLGDHVVHRTKADWGVGKIVEANALDVSVFFVQGGRRQFSLSTDVLLAAPPEAVDHALLTNMSQSAHDPQGKFRPLPECVAHFLRLFPKGFSDPKFLGDANQGERNYKLAAVALAQELLSESAWQELAHARRYEEICQRLAKVDSKTNLLHTMEKIKWQTALKDEAFQPLIADALFDDLYGTASRMRRFDRLATVLGQADGCAKWTIATYYGYLIHPKERMYVKPEVTKAAAEACGWDLKYRPALNWSTLEQAEGLARFLFDEFTKRELAPRDMLDIQSFIWCIPLESYGE